MHVHTYMQVYISNARFTKRFGKIPGCNQKVSNEGFHYVVKIDKYLQ